MPPTENVKSLHLQWVDAKQTAIRLHVGLTGARKGAKLVGTNQVWTSRGNRGKKKEEGEERENQNRRIKGQWRREWPLFQNGRH